MDHTDQELITLAKRTYFSWQFEENRDRGYDFEKSMTLKERFKIFEDEVKRRKLELKF